jgi:NAD(P)-dependent dehydrogenase (short-subunit alcohol dehydrogenase family)
MKVFWSWQSHRSSKLCRDVVDALGRALKDGGCVVNVASIAGYGWRQNLERTRGLVGVQGFPDLDALVAEFGIRDEESYPISKEALLLWTLRAAHPRDFQEPRHSHQCSESWSGRNPILREFRAVLGNDRVDSDLSRVGRAGTSPDRAPAIAFLCSDGARWINGANLPVDGGLEASITADVIGF